MTRPKKQTTETPTAPAENVTQSTVSTLATQALTRMQNTRVRLALRLLGSTEMLMQRWTTKAITQMLMPQVTGTRAPREPKDLTKAFEDSWYRNVEGAPAVPCRMVKAAIVSGAISTGKSVSKAELRRQLRIIGNTAPILRADDDSFEVWPIDKKTGKPEGLDMDISIVRNSSGVPDVRSRAKFHNWAIEVVLEFSPAMLAVDKVMAAVRAAGDSIGLGEWRPENGGELGQFTVEVLQDKDVARILKASVHPEEPFIIPQELLKAIASGDEPTSDPQRKVRSLAKGAARQSEIEASMTGTNGAAE